MGLKAFMLLSLGLAIFVNLTLEVAARELAESSTNFNTVESTEKSAIKNEVNDAKYPRGGYLGGGFGGYPGGGFGGYPGRWYGGYCRYGCCQRNFYGDGCYRCCYPVR
ncbi:hypothetical protein HAX54_000184 [Datura stramonium]|uniref:Glycine-rich protein n=1 Tax=Datura stramonium TaxID=4076 RepID=A0ABS8T1M6_DATST|nr:hypothetical protein [Datura stramonium]